MMPVSDEYLIYITDQLSDLGEIECKRMFGGAGIYCDGLFFAIVVDDELYFKVDDSNRTDYESAGTGPFIYETKDKQMQMSYYLVPPDVLEGRDLLNQWADKAIVVAEKAKKTKKNSKKKAKKKVVKKKQKRKD